jgi:medium-chain acyl-[acyl-carrier-protein] hydrolase
MKKINLFCFPYAGGSSVIYSKWKPYIEEFVNLMPVELSGRGRRISERSYSSMNEAVDDVYNIVSPLLDDSPYALLGHSMGCILTFELYNRIRQCKKQEPLHLFLSGRYPPSVHRDEANVHSLPDDEFKEKILSYGGTPSEIFDDKEISKVFVPIIRADYKIIEEYKYTDKGEKINCDMSVFCGSRDIISTKEESLLWRDFANKSFKFYEFDGGHFFIHDYTREIADIINRILNAHFRDLK